MLSLCQLPELLCRFPEDRINGEVVQDLSEGKRKKRKGLLLRESRMPLMRELSSSQLCCELLEGNCNQFPSKISQHNLSEIVTSTTSPFCLRDLGEMDLFMGSGNLIEASGPTSIYICANPLCGLACRTSN